jgi:hypothetical protein
MKNKILSVVLTFLVSTPFVAAQAIISDMPVFLNGEELTYRLRWGIITLGEGNIKVTKEQLRGKQVFHSVLIGRTTGVGAVYKIYDVYESYFCPTTNLPERAIRNIREGDYRYYDEVDFNQEENFVISKRNGKVEVPQNTLDMASVLYYMRRIDLTKLKINDIIAFDTYFGDEIFPFYIVYKGKETISVSAGKFNCFKFVPIVEPGRIFEKKDDMTIWFTDDENKMPIAIRFILKYVGALNIELTKFSNLKYPLTAKIK